MVVIGAGTCGTLTGVARKIKERQPNCKVRKRAGNREPSIIHPYLSLSLSLYLLSRLLQLILMVQYWPDLLSLMMGLLRVTW